MVKCFRAIDGYSNLTKQETTPMKLFAVSLILFSAAFFSGCQTGNSPGSRANLQNSFEKSIDLSTIDSSASTPTDNVVGHGPYRLVLDPPVHAFFSKDFWRDSSLTRLREKRDLLMKTHGVPIAEEQTATRADDLLSIVEGIQQGNGGGNVLDFLDRVLIVRDKIARIHNNGDFDFRMMPDADSPPGLRADALMLNLGLTSGSFVDKFDFDDLHSSVTNRLGSLFPEHGSGKIIRVQLVSLFDYDNVRRIYTDGVALYLMTGRGPIRKYEFQNYSFYALCEGDAWDARIISCPAPFHAHRRHHGGEMSMSDGSKVKLYEKQPLKHQFACALVELLNGLSESDFNELEVSAW